MSQRSYRANLTAAEFPLLTDFQGRNIIISDIDQNYSRQANSPKNKDRDIGIPQVYYMHNVMPTDAGISSTGYQTLIQPPADTDSTFNEQNLLRDPNENVAYFNHTDSGRNYILLSLGSGWIRTTSVSPIAGRKVTFAYVNGETYICFGGTGTYKYTFATNTLTPVTLTSLDPTKIMGITASSGYMIAWTDTLVLWSSTVDPTDFTPSLVTGAGGGGVQSVKAAITCCLPQNSGFIVYTKKNAVSSLYTGNAQFPFAYKELIGAGGLADQSLVAYDGNSTDHFVYTTAGLQEISVNNAALIFSPVTDFLAGSQFEDFNDTTLTFLRQTLSVPMKKKVTMVSNRYLVISYGVTQLTHALVYDFGLARWGKLKIPHVDCFEYTYPSPDVVDTPRRSIGFVQADGTILIAIISYDTTGSNGTVLVGKYQLDRNNYLDMQEIHLESIKTNNSLTVRLLSSVDGLNTSTTLPVLAVNTTTYRRYNCRASGLNHSILFLGSFHLNSMELRFGDGGEVR